MFHGVDIPDDVAMRADNAREIEEIIRHGGSVERVTIEVARTLSLYCKCSEADRWGDE